jgi:hypothetical protein
MLFDSQTLQVPEICRPAMAHNVETGQVEPVRHLPHRLAGISQPPAAVAAITARNT